MTRRGAAGGLLHPACSHVTVTSEQRARIAIASAPNLRDVGGRPTKGGGRVRSGLVFRSAGLDRLHGEDLAAFAEFGLHTVYDLRTTHELAAQPDVLPDGVHSVHLDVLGDASHAAPAELQQLFEQPSRAAELLGDGQAERYFEDAYRDFVSLPSAKAAYAGLFTGLAEADRLPALYHCTAGKDRTGWGTAVLLMLLGVPDEEVLEDYLLTNDELLTVVEPWMDAFAEIGGDPALLAPILGVQESFLAAALAEVQREYGDLEGYLTRGLGLAPETLDRLRAALVEPG